MNELVNSMINLSIKGERERMKSEGKPEHLWPTYNCYDCPAKDGLVIDLSCEFCSKNPFIEDSR